jgi:hypothetical protein
MSAVGTNTWDITPAAGGARRPALADMGGAQMADDGPVDKGTMFYADLGNQLQRQVASQGQSCPIATVWIRYSGGYSVHRSIGPSSSISTLGFFTITPVSTGIVRVTWVAGTLPQLSGEPHVTLQRAFGRCYSDMISGNPNGFEVRIQNSSDVAANLDFMATLY